MARKPSRYPTELELEILKILWRDGPSPVRHVRAALRDFRELAHTSVLTVMNIMTRKRYVQRRMDGNTYVYKARLDREETVQTMLQDMVDRMFDGSAGAVALQLLETAGLDEAELKRVRAVLARDGKGQPS